MSDAPSLRESRKLAAKRYAVDPSYGPPTNWSRLYAKYCPEHTDGCSRHASMLAENLRDPQSPFRQVLMDAGYEPDHWARSLEVTVKALWQTRAELAELKGPERVARERAAAVAKAVASMGSRKDGSSPQNQDVAQ